MPPGSAASDSGKPATDANGLTLVGRMLHPRTVDYQHTPDRNLIIPGDDITEDQLHPTTAALVAKLMAKLMKPVRAVPEDTLRRVYKEGTVRISLARVKAQLTEAHFIYNPRIHRSVLRNDSKVRRYGLQAGLPRGYWEWLCGDWLVETIGEDLEWYPFDCKTLHNEQSR
jgi:hypothetical protein